MDYVDRYPLSQPAPASTFCKPEPDTNYFLAPTEALRNLDATSTASTTCNVSSVGPALAARSRTAFAQIKLEDLERHEH